MNYSTQACPLFIPKKSIVHGYKRPQNLIYVFQLTYIGTWSTLADYLSASLLANRDIKWTSYAWECMEVWYSHPGYFQWINLTFSLTYSTYILDPSLCPYSILIVSSSSHPINWKEGNYAAITGGRINLTLIGEWG